MNLQEILENYDKFESSKIDIDGENFNAIVSDGQSTFTALFGEKQLNHLANDKTKQIESLNNQIKFIQDEVAKAESFNKNVSLILSNLPQIEVEND